MACAYRGCFKVYARTSILPAHFKFSAPLACLVMTASIMDLRHGHYFFFEVEMELRPLDLTLYSCI
jgi:hypothetical protein